MRVIHVHKGYGGQFFLVPAQYRDRTRRKNAEAALTRVKAIVPGWLHTSLDALRKSAHNHGIHLQLEEV